MLFSSVNLFLWAIYFPWQTVSHNPEGNFAVPTLPLLAAPRKKPWQDCLKTSMDRPKAMGMVLVCWNSLVSPQICWCGKPNARMGLGYSRIFMVDGMRWFMIGFTALFPSIPHIRTKHVESRSPVGPVMFLCRKKNLGQTASFFTVLDALVDLVELSWLWCGDESRHRVFEIYTWSILIHLDPWRPRLSDWSAS